MFHNRPPALSEIAGASSNATWSSSALTYINRETWIATLQTPNTGAIPVPIYPPMRLSQLEDHLRRQTGILRNAGEMNSRRLIWHPRDVALQSSAWQIGIGAPVLQITARHAEYYVSGLSQRV
jgi:hypothetical protein